MASGEQPDHRIGDDRWVKKAGELYDAHGEALYGYLMALLGSPQEAEDALQEVFARLLARPRRLARVRDAQAYLFRAARNEAFSRLRRRVVRKRGEQLLHQTQSILEAAAGGQVSREEVERVNDALRQLPPEQREVIVLKVFRGMTFNEIGKVVGVSPNTAASRYRYALARLRAVLKVEGNG